MCQHPVGALWSVPAGDTSCSAGMIFGAEHLEGIDPVPQTRAERSRGPASRPPARSPHLFGERLKKRDGDARWGWGGKSHSGYALGSAHWAKATAYAFDTLLQKECAEVAKPEWWNDEGMTALSARVVRAAPNYESALDMRAIVLSGFSDAWEAEPRSVAELKEAATCFDRSAALCDAPAWKAESFRLADRCRSRAEAHM